MDWQSWGHSHSTPVAGELDERHPLASYQGRQLWPGSTTTSSAPRPQPPLDFRYFRDWVYAGHRSDITKAYAVAPSFPVGSAADALPLRRRRRRPDRAGKSTGGGSLVTNRGGPCPGTSGYTSSSPFGPNYTETSAVESSLSPEPPVTDPPGTLDPLRHAAADRAR